jgi:hypothetical protein
MNIEGRRHAKLHESSQMTDEKRSKAERNLRRTFSMESRA